MNFHETMLERENVIMLHANGTITDAQAVATMNQLQQRDPSQEVRRAIEADKIAIEFDAATKSLGMKETDRDFYAVKCGIMSVEVARLREQLSQCRTNGNSIAPR